jgi:hypothetical protein
MRCVKTYSGQVIVVFFVLVPKSGCENILKYW